MAAITVISLVRYSTPLFSATPLVDEATYLEAFHVAGAGGSPYSVTGFFYPPAFAALGGWALEAVPRLWVLVALRSFNLIGVIWLVWRCARLARFPPAATLIGASAVIALAPGVSLGLASGNVSPAVCAVMVAGALGWSRRSFASGVALASTLALKPLAVGALPVLLLHRSRWSRPRLGPFLASSAVALLALLPGHRFLVDFLRVGKSVGIEAFPLNRTASLHRLLFNLGLETDRLALFCVVLAAFLVVGRWRAWEGHGLTCLALTAATLTAPALWSHTLLLTLPLQALALRGLFARVEDGTRAATPVEAAALVACMLTLHFSEGVGGLAPGPSIAVAVALVPVLLAPVVLTTWVVRRSAGPRESSAVRALPSAEPRDRGLAGR